jgi:hypothetical protein
MTVTIQPDTIGNEILKAIVNNRNRKVEEYNRKQAFKYYDYCLKTGDKTLINFAASKL